ncbi:BamA/TamA family outer membrane protein [Prevotella corporis]|uniref:translocation and assembly module lipoprotein TamL n=1 Tax=Prevotella corporis TaxID=28128 RepID=UPI0027E59E60|nr:BamA/TamA family outer membrane protein [Prevotella corporis]MDQ7736064.1 BamA/TamA family outer membrane protein [Prevotella corporis]
MFQDRLFKFYNAILILLLVLLIASCSAEKFVADGKYMLDKVEIKSDVKDFDALQFAQLIRQKGNSRWFSFFKIPLGTYALSGRDTTKWINRTLQKMGEKPVLYDTLEAQRSKENLRVAMNNMGYMNATVDLETKVKGKILKAIYTLHPGSPYQINSFNYDIQDSVIASLLEPSLTSKFDKNHPRQFIVSALDNERKRLTKILNDSGYYRFNKDFIYYTADSTKGSKEVDLTLHLAKYRTNNDSEPILHPRYIINKVNILPGNSTGVNLRKGVIAENNLIEPGRYFSSSDLQKTYNNFARLGAVRYTNIDFRELNSIENIIVGKTFNYQQSQKHYLDVDITLSSNKPNTISFQPEGTNTAGNLGAAAVLSYQNRNLFRGSELLSVELRAAFEAITGLEGYENHDYEEYGIQTSLQFPRFLSPFVSRDFRRRSNAVSEASISWNLQNRPEFHRRVFSAMWKYRWANPTKHFKYGLDVLNLSYVYMPWISSTFKTNYLDDISNRNAILRYNYEDLLVMRMGFSVIYNYNDQAIRAQFETAGNLLNGVSRIFNLKKNDQGQRMLFNIAYAQYAKFDFDYTKIISFDENNSLVLHGDFGVAWPYGNSKVLPFEKRYIAGGPNSVRGWSVRELGPGKFKGSDGRIDFINQTGDLKLDLNLEYRTHLFWKFDGAAYIDAGNIWTLRNYEEQQGGQFKIGEFYKQLAFAYGLGLRLNFNYFILRFDTGMKAINPVYDDFKEHYALFNPNFTRDFTFHFAVGLPF